MSFYFCLSVRNIQDQDLDLLTGACFEAGASGVEEVLDFEQPNLEYDAKEVPKKFHDIKAYFDQRPSDEFIEALQENFTGIEPEVLVEEHRDWLEEWKKGFKPFSLVGPYWVVPSWMRPPAEALVPLVIDPGMAFGTGTHATTQLAARLFVEESQNRAPFSAIDVGTGTGILAMLAQHQGAQRILALDNDPEARRVGRENLKLNGLTRIELPETQIERIEEKFDFVIANIIDGVLIKLKNHLLRTMKPDGSLILSGILVERDDEFIRLFLKGTNLKIKSRETQDEWVGYVLA